MFPKKFSHRPPLYDLYDKAELRALHPLCRRYILREHHVIVFLQKRRCRIILIEMGFEYMIEIFQYTLFFVM